MLLVNRVNPDGNYFQNGGSFAGVSGAVSEIGLGLYKIAGNATDSNTVGELWIHATGTGQIQRTRRTLLWHTTHLILFVLADGTTQRCGGYWKRWTTDG